MTDIRTFLHTGMFASFEEATDSEPGLVKKALVAVEGTFKDSKGNEHTFTPERLTTIAEHTNRALSTGITIPVCTDHQKDVKSTVGVFGDNAQAYTKVITEEDLPNKKAKHLIGKIGLFVNDVVLKVPEVIEKVKNKVVTSVSMGLNLSKDDHRIMELSLVPISAIPNMGLFGFTGNSQALTWEDLERNEQTIEDLKEDFQKLSDQLWTIISNIYTDDSIDIASLDILKQYVYTALNGFSIRVLDILGLSDESLAATSTEEISGENADTAQQIGMTQRQDIASTSASPGNSMYSRAPRYQRAEFSINRGINKYYKRGKRI